MLAGNGGTNPDSTARIGNEQLSQLGAARLRAQRFSSVVRQTPGMMVANICNALVLVVALWGTPQQVAGICWCAALFSIVALIWRPNRSQGKRRSDNQRSSATVRAAVNALALGLCWAAAPLLFFQAATPGGRILITCLSSGMLCGGAFALATIPFAAVAFTSPIAVASFLVLIQSSEREYWLAAGVLGVYITVLMKGVFAFSEQLETQVLTQLETENIALNDALTGLPNRRAFQAAAEKKFQRIAISGERFFLVSADLDNFKEINDRLGHLAGDGLLVSVAKRMREAVGPADFIARLGGDEFVILGTSAPDEAGAIALGRRILGCFQEPFILEGHETIVSASLGIASAPQDGGDLRTLQRNTDIALYNAKKSCGTLSLFEPRHNIEAREAHNFQLDLRRAVQSNDFSLAFQPVLNLGDGSIVGCEALARWLHPTRSHVSPSLFIPAAERLGLINDLGLWVAENACRAAALFPLGMRVAINVSPLQLRDPEFPEKLLSCAAEAGIPAHAIEIEITESALLSDDQTSQSAILMLSRAGIKISLDDFGTGYSSLTYLRKIPLERIKIDQTFIADVLTDKSCAAIVTGILDLARNLDIKIVAEGVESLDQLRWLRAKGCSEVQGYFVSKPLREAEFLTFLDKWRPLRVAA